MRFGNDIRDISQRHKLAEDRQNHCQNHKTI